MKRIIIIVAIIAVLGGGSFYFFVIRDTSDKPEPRIEYTPSGDYFTTNVVGGRRLLKTSLILVVNEKGLEEFLESENGRIRDTIIFILRDLTEEQILEPGTQDILRDRILTELNERLGIDNFVEVLFNDFVMQ